MLMAVQSVADPPCRGGGGLIEVISQTEAAKSGCLLRNRC